MNTKRYLLTGAVLLTSFTQIYAKSNKRGKNDKKMNVLMFIVDDLRPELGCYGVDEIKTPNIDRMASRGTLFQNAYCNIPVSGASRASLLTGVYPQFPKRFTHFEAIASQDAPWAIPISEWFTQNGYHTISNGKVFHVYSDHLDTWSETPWRVNPEGYGHDWAVYNKWEQWVNNDSGEFINNRTKRGPFCEAGNVDDAGYEDGKGAVKTIEDLKRLKKMDKPFFLAYGLWRPHLPFNSPKKYWDMYNRDSISMAPNRFRPEGLPKEVKSSGEVYTYAKVNIKSESFQKEAKHGYYAAVSYVDAQIGKVLDELERLDMADNTVVILFGDHGWHLGEHNFWGKHNLMQNATRVPLIISTPNGKGEQSYSPVEYVDIYPTLCDLCGIPQPENQLDGTSMVPILKNPKAKTKDYVFIQWQNGVNVVSNQFSFGEWPSGSRMLFNHAIDPAENKNVAADSQYSSQMVKFSRFIKDKKAANRTKHEGK